MHHKPSNTPSKRSRNNPKLVTSTSAQHGDRSQLFSVLLALPSESLTHVTTYLDPVSLLALSRTNRHLFEHVKNDNTWLRAFAYQFLGIKAEDDLHEGNHILLRRIEPTWRKEFIARWSLRRRWERSRNPTVMHVPHHSNIAGIHVMSESGLLTSSLFYGVVSRSVPLTGKILKGYIDAAGTGLGIGNPNAEFAPDVSACALTSEGAIARVLWGFRSGSVAITIAPRAMHTTRPISRLLRCSVPEQHGAEVRDAAWAVGQAFCVTGAADGTVKAWDAKSMHCLWTSPRREGPAVACVKVAIDVSAGLVAGAMADGEVVAWLGEFAEHEFHVAQEIRVAPPGETPGAMPSTLFVSVDEDTRSLLTSYANDRYLYRVDLKLESSTYSRILFGEDSSGAVRSVYPAFATKAREYAFIVTGDQLGFVRIFDWRDGSIISRFEASEDGTPITALALNDHVLVTGSERGIGRVWDMLTLAPLRHFPIMGSVGRFVPNVVQPISAIALEREMVVIAAGTRVLAWKAGPVSTHVGKAMTKNSKNVKRVGATKGQKYFEMSRDIHESARLLEYEQAQTRQQYEREREHHATLADIGLSEFEALDYVLQLSRDEEEERQAREIATMHDDGVFQGDFDDITATRLSAEHVEASWPSVYPSDNSTGEPTSSRPRASPPSPSSPARIRSEARLIPAGGPSRVQVAQREPMEAGFSHSYTRSLSSQGPSPSVPSSGDEQHFPPMSRTPSSVSGSTPSTPSVVARSLSGGASPSWTGVGPSYSAAARATPSSPVASGIQTTAWGSPVRRGSSSGGRPRSEPLTMRDTMSFSPRMMAVQERGSREDQEDEDLRLAIELSLAEARSRGEAV